MTIADSYIAVTEEIETAGASVWWRLSGDLARGALTQEIINVNLDPEIWGPREASSERCFSRAVKALYRDKTHNVETLKGGGFAVVAKAKTDTNVRHTTEFAVKLVNKKPEGVGEYPAPTHELLRIIDSSYYYASHLISDDVSAWLISCAERLGAVPLRDRGGIYFIPSHALPTWKSLVKALNAASNGAHRVYSLPTLKNEDAVEAILDALTVECEKFFEKRREEIEAGEIGKRALRNRQNLSEELGAKIEKYEKLLGRKLEELTDNLGEVETELAAALLAAEFEADKERGSAPIPLVV